MRTTSSIISVVFFSFMTAHLSGCSPAVRAQRICDPGATQSCVCPTGDGAQVCKSDGSGWKACVCGSANDAGQNDLGLGDSSYSDAGTWDQSVSESDTGSSFDVESASDAGSALDARLSGDASQASCQNSGLIENCTLDFAEVTVPDHKTLEIIVINPSSSPLTITDVNFSTDTNPAFQFADSWSELSLASGEQIGIAVTFTPTTEAEVYGKVYISHNDSSIASPIAVLLRGRGLIPEPAEIDITPDTCQFGDVGLDSTAFCDLTLRNNGEESLTITAYGGDGNFSSTDPQSIFKLANDFNTPLLLPGQMGATVRISCTPAAAQTYTGQVYFDSDAASTPHKLVTLSCTGAEVTTAVARIKSIDGQSENLFTSQLALQSEVVLTAADSTAGSPQQSIASYSWELVEKPAHSTVNLTNFNLVDTKFMFNASGEPHFAFDVSGTYVVRLRVTDSEGSTSTNNARIALNVTTHAFVEVELTWDHPDADLDLHFIRNDGAAWSGDDCHFANCKGVDGLDWGGGAANPRLVIDTVDGYGPEQTNLPRPNLGQYKVAVHYYSPHSSSPALNAHVKVFVFGSLLADYTKQMTECNEWWDVAQIDWPSATITPINDVSMDSHGSCF